MFSFKCLHHQAPTTLSNSLSTRSYSRLTGVATNSNLELTMPNTRRKTFSVCGPQLWNSLPDYLKSIPEFKSFKTSLKTFLFKWAFSQRVWPHLSSHLLQLHPQFQRIWLILTIQLWFLSLLYFINLLLLCLSILTSQLNVLNCSVIALNFNYSTACYMILYLFI